MLKKAARFTRNSFPRKRPATRKSLSWGSLSVYPDESGAAVVVSKKVSPKAHERNRIKRRVYEALSHISKKNGVVVFPRKEALTLPLQTLIEDLQKNLA